MGAATISEGGSQRVWRRSKALEAVGSSEYGSKR